MSEWITDRAPDPDQDQVFVTLDDRVTVSCSRFVYRDWEDGQKHAWMPVEKPEPYTPPKPKRREYTIPAKKSDNSIDYSYDIDSFVPVDMVKVREVLPGDPHPDTVQSVADEMERLASNVDSILPNVVKNWAKMLKSE